MCCRVKVVERDTNVYVLTSKILYLCLGKIFSFATKSRLAADASFISPFYGTIGYPA